MSKSFHIDQPKPSGDWIGWRAWFELTGSQHYGKDVGTFAAAAGRPGANSGCSVEREPTNPFDKNAIAFYGLVDSGRYRLGFIPRTDAKDLAVYPPEMPLAGRIMSIRFHNDSVFVRVQLLLPSKKVRVASGWEPQSA